MGGEGAWGSVLPATERRNANASRRLSLADQHLKLAFDFSALRPTKNGAQSDHTMAQPSLLVFEFDRYQEAARRPLRIGAVATGRRNVQPRPRIRTSLNETTVAPLLTLVGRLVAVYWDCRGPALARLSRSWKCAAQDPLLQ
jgi:hypothetical protein